MKFISICLQAECLMNIFSILINKHESVFVDELIYK